MSSSLSGGDVLECNDMTVCDKLCIYTPESQCVTVYARERAESSPRTGATVIAGSVIVSLNIFTMFTLLPIKGFPVSALCVSVCAHVYMCMLCVCEKINIPAYMLMDGHQVSSSVASAVPLIPSILPMNLELAIFVCVCGGVRLASSKSL